MMVFGHNSNLKLGSNTLHVQTEDRGGANALIDTTVYFQGRVLHRRTNNYHDLLPMNEDNQQALKLRVDEQHRTVLEAIRSGELPLAIPQPTSASANAAPGHFHQAGANSEQPPAVVVQPPKLVLELLNARSWLAGKQATLHIAVKEEGGAIISGAIVIAEIEGSAGHPPFSSQTGADGQATILFEMPKLTGAEPALVIRAEAKKSSALLRFSLRAKPRVPAV
ncbi:MAG TPA: hypothetical protein VGP66_11845 [Candidatus Acidoferrum sp.]|jgi:hypothetical protein|nr:hypothetical protein [Candidatus Acidoferrum sp.]